MPLRLASGSGLLAVQLIMACAGFTALVASPPANGRILIVPLSAKAASTMVGRSLATGARLLGPGPFRDSVVVDGSRADLASALHTPEVLLLAAPHAECRA